MTAPPVTAPVTAYVALGANLGEPLLTLRWAKAELGQLGRVSGQSALYRTAPVGGPTGQPDYLNAAVRLETALGPAELLGALHELEAQAGRERHGHWEARVLDLDLITYGERVQAGPPELPHPRAWERAFVLAPLRDLGPQLRHPDSGETVEQALARVGLVGVERVEAGW